MKQQRNNRTKASTNKTRRTPKKLQEQHHAAIDYEKGQDKNDADTEKEYKSCV